MAVNIASALISGEPFPEVVALAVTALRLAGVICNFRPPLLGPRGVVALG